MADAQNLADEADDLAAQIERVTMDLDAWLALNVEDLPRRSYASILNGRGHLGYASGPLRRVRSELEAAAEARGRRAVPSAAKDNDFDVMMTAKLIAAGQLPADATPADFRALQAKRTAETATIAAKGSVGEQLAKLAEAGGGG